MDPGLTMLRSWYLKQDRRVKEGILQHGQSPGCGHHGGLVAPRGDQHGGGVLQLARQRAHLPTSVRQTISSLPS